MILQDRQKDDSWATPFEVHLAARAFNCIIRLSATIDTEPEVYCYYPDPPETYPHLSATRSRAPPIIFLESTILENGQFYFQWLQVSPKISREGNLFTALRNWLKQDDIRPITYDQLGKDEKDFKRKCSETFTRAHETHLDEISKTNPTVMARTFCTFDGLVVNVTIILQEFILRCIAFQFRVSIMIHHQIPIFNIDDQTPEIDMVARKDEMQDDVDSFGSDKVQRNYGWDLPSNDVAATSHRDEPTLHLYWDALYQEFVCCCIGLKKSPKETESATLCYN